MQNKVSAIVGISFQTFTTLSAFFAISASAEMLNIQDVQSQFEHGQKPTDAALAKSYLCEQTGIFWYQRGTQTNDKDGHMLSVGTEIAEKQLSYTYTLKFEGSSNGNYLGHLVYTSLPKMMSDMEHGISMVDVDKLETPEVDQYSYQFSGKTLVAHGDVFDDQYRASGDKLIFETFVFEENLSGEGLTGEKAIPSNNKVKGKLLADVGVCTIAP